MAAVRDLPAEPEREALRLVAARKQDIVETRHARRVLKRGIDVAGAVAGLVVLAPLLLLVAVVVAVDSPGPVLFRQRRYGRDLRAFTIFKFRTMHADASPDLHRRHFAFLAGDPDIVPNGSANGSASGSVNGFGNGSVNGSGNELKKVTDDPRLTRSGRLLRTLSLDELPQLINVLRGEMSLVGPRPAIGYELDYYRPADFDRFAVRPGMTGLWQVSGRNELGVREMLDLDVRYVHEWSLALDARILARTPRAAVKGSA